MMPLWEIANLQNLKRNFISAISDMKMNDIKMMELSMDEWEEISRNHTVSCDSMMEFLEEIMENQTHRYL